MTPRSLAGATRVVFVPFTLTGNVEGEKSLRKDFNDGRTEFGVPMDAMPNGVWSLGRGLVFNEATKQRYEVGPAEDGRCSPGKAPNSGQLLIC